MRKRAYRLSLFVAASAASLTAQAAAAQAGSADDSQPAALEEVIVTATKREVRLQDVPVSVTVVSEQRLQQTGTLSTADLPALAPGLRFSPSASSPRTTQFIIRGVGTFAATNALETSVGVTIDGVPIPRASGQATDMVDVDRIEVLRGPQGTLFGKNATAGVISINTKRPRLGETTLSGAISAGSYSELNIDVAQNIALGDSAALRLTAWRYYHDGYLRSATDSTRYGDRNTFGVRAGLTFAPTERLTYTVIGQYDGRDQRGVISTPLLFVPRSLPAIVAASNALGIVPGPNNRVGDAGNAPYGRSDNYSLTGIGDYDLGGGFTLSSVSGYREVNIEGRFDPIGFRAPTIDTISTSDEQHQSFSQELRIASPADQRLSYVAGLFYYTYSVDDVSTQTGVALPVIGGLRSVNPQHVEQDNYAIFGEATFRVLPTLRLLAGVRQSHDKISGRYSRVLVGTVTPPVPPTFQPIEYRPDSIEYDFTSYRVGFQYDVTPDIMLYGTVSRGYKGPGYNFTSSLTTADVTNFGAEVAAETAQSYEVGLKGQLFDRRVAFNLAAYHSTFEDFQATVAVSLSPPVYSIRNANELESQGVEFDVTARLARGLTVGVSGAYTDAKYTDFQTAPCYGGQPRLPAGSPLTPGFCVNGIQNLNGVRLPQAPEWVLNWNARYERDFGDNWTGFATTDATYTSQVSYQNTNDPFLVQDGYTIVNATVGFGPQDGSWKLSAYGRNLFDKSFRSSIREFNGYYQQIFPYEASRRVGVMLNFNF